MSGVPHPPYGSRSRGVSSADVERAADKLLRAGERPTVEKIRASLGTGSPNTINPLLDAWWKRLASRLDSGPAALHRLPESVVHIAESLWLQALEEARRRALLELGSDKRVVEQAKDGYEVRSHVLSLREGELDARLRDRERSIAEMEAQLRTLTTLLKKEQRNRENLDKRVQDLKARTQEPRAMPLQSEVRRHSQSKSRKRKAKAVKKRSLTKTKKVTRVSKRASRGRPR